MEEDATKADAKVEDVRAFLARVLRERELEASRRRVRGYRARRFGVHGDGIYGDDERVREREEDVRGEWV